LKLVISDPKTGKAFQKKLDNIAFVLNKKIGDEISLDSVGLHGFKAVITGGSDKQGFPMRPDLNGTARKKLFKGKGIGFRQKRKGLRKKKSVRGNTVSNAIEQLNVKISVYGEKPFESFIEKTVEGKEKTEKSEAGSEKK
jgi:small subunit ribosomal protein S6e